MGICAGAEQLQQIKIDKKSSSSFIKYVGHGHA